MTKKCWMGVEISGLFLTLPSYYETMMLIQCIIFLQVVSVGQRNVWVVGDSWKDSCCNFQIQERRYGALLNSWDNRKSSKISRLCYLMSKLLFYSWWGQAHLDRCEPNSIWGHNIQARPDSLRVRCDGPHVQVSWRGRQHIPQVCLLSVDWTSVHPSSPRFITPAWIQHVSGSDTCSWNFTTGGVTGPCSLTTPTRSPYHPYIGAYLNLNETNSLV